jgi:hypothetical protein
MAGDKKKKNEGKAAKLAFREREASQSGPQRHFSTRTEDVVRTLQDGRVLAKTTEGKLYLTTSFYLQMPFADPNRYGRPSSQITEEAAALLH